MTQTTGPATAASTGLSVYFPPFADIFRQGYLFLEDIPVWPDLLQSFFTAGEAIPEAEQPPSSTSPVRRSTSSTRTG